MTQTASARWSSLGSVPALELSRARRAVHWAAQAIGQAGRALLPALPDDSQTNLLWQPNPGRFEGRPLPGGHRVALDVATYSVAIVDAAGAETADWPLAGLTFEALLERVAEHLGAAGEPVPEAGLARPPYDLPPGAIADGGTFPELDGAALSELAAWFGNAFGLLSELAAGDERASEVRCWPHHFDIATLLALDPDVADAEAARSVGVGLSPGDGSYDQPYFYITPWPYPDGGLDAALEGGARWHREGWFGAVLTAETVALDPAASAQRQRARDAVRSALTACLDWLESA